MSYSLDLVRLPTDVDPEAAYEKHARETEEKLRRTRGDQGPLDPGKEQRKQDLARALVTRHPNLRVARRDFAALATLHDIEISEAERRFRDIELNDERHSIQITLFDDAAGVALSPSETVDECTRAMTLLWDCLEILHSRGGFSAFDPQVGKLLNLDSDFDLVRATVCGPAGG